MKTLKILGYAITLFFVLVLFPASILITTLISGNLKKLERIGLKGKLKLGEVIALIMGITLDITKIYIIVKALLYL